MKKLRNIIMQALIILVASTFFAMAAATGSAAAALYRPWGVPASAEKPPMPMVSYSAG